MGLFHFRHFDIDDRGCGMKICSDSVLLAAWFLPSYRGARSVLDVGTGSGVLALLAAEICPAAEIIGVEIDPAAYDAAKANFRNSPWASRLHAVHADVNDFTASAPDIIISNPPYFTNGERSSDAARCAARHQDGFGFDTLLNLPLAEGGHIGMVTPADAYDNIIFDAEMRRRKLRRLCRVATAPGKAPSRLLWDFSDTDGDFVEHTLNLRDASGYYSDEYRRLTEPYYQKLPLR